MTVTISVLRNIAAVLAVLIQVNLSAGATVLFDDFGDDNALDGVPIAWSGGTIENGNLLLAGTGYLSAYPIGDAIDSLAGTSVRIQFTRPDGCCIGVAARYTPGAAATNYYASFSTWTGWRGVAVGVGV